MVIIGLCIPYDSSATHIAPFQRFVFICDRGIDGLLLMGLKTLTNLSASCDSFLSYRFICTLLP